MVVQARRFFELNEFWELNAIANADWPYTVAWIDCLARSKTGTDRGVLHCGRHAAHETGPAPERQRHWRIGIDPPFPLVNRSTAGAFNHLDFSRQGDARQRDAALLPFFYPLDSVLDWNRVYGKRGFFQYQCVLPHADARDALPELLERIVCSRETPFLGVLKSFGDLPPAGLLSFARPGVTLSVDFPNRGASTTRLLDDLDTIDMDAGGALYPAKDARMPPSVFRSSFPSVNEFARYVDPGASSSFWRRVTA